MSFMDWDDAVNAIELKLDSYLESLGWERNEYAELVGVVDFSDGDDPARYIGERPLSIIMADGGDRVYGEGIDGVASFMSESWTTMLEEELVERLADTRFALIAEEEAWIYDNEVWEEVSSYIQGFIRPSIDYGALGQWLASQGY